MSPRFMEYIAREILNYCKDHAHVALREKTMFEIRWSEHNIQNRIPAERRQSSWPFKSVAEQLYSGLPRNKFRSERDSNPGPLDCESDALTTWPRCLPTDSLSFVVFCCQQQKSRESGRLIREGDFVKEMEFTVSQVFRSFSLPQHYQKDITIIHQPCHLGLSEPLMTSNRK